jgi:hypothetical protein
MRTFSSLVTTRPLPILADLPNPERPVAGMPALTIALGVVGQGARAWHA